MSTVAVVQARTGSTRFPNKVLAELNGRPMLCHLLERLGRCVTLDRVVVATSTSPSDDAIVELAERAGVLVTRGSLDDVLQRVLMAAQQHGATVVVRITADCPLVDPEVVDAVVRLRAESGADYASNVEPRTYPDGYDVEVMTRECLERAAREAVRPDEREHVTLRIRQHPDDYRLASLRNDRDLSEMRLTVDVPEDLVRVSAVLTALLPDTMPGIAAVVRCVEANGAAMDQRLAGTGGLSVGDAGGELSRRSEA